MVDLQKAVPVPDMDTQPFWDACHDHELRGQRCASCGRFRWPPQGFCPACYSWESEWTQLSGSGIIRSFSVVHHSAIPAFKDATPYAVAVIELDGTEGKVLMKSNVVDVAWTDLKVGMSVQVAFEDRTPEVTLPVFRLATPLPDPYVGSRS